ncbi:hypothetical protein ALC56_11886 [Trachymyrmex septentrionalis]|uniref:Uncharacterized protein n=1 Tax=Trachymyrmex septentrionalis TaxID=34720 RepID=A0A195EZS7_9HYME|nr:hypothetical protein ALC56_11886 [Trachymyrmex septentrionalis]
MCLPTEIPSYKCPAYGGDVRHDESARFVGGLRGRMSAEILEMFNLTKSRTSGFDGGYSIETQRPFAISVQAIKSFHNYATPDRCMVQRETLKGLSVARSKKRLRRETEKREEDSL